VSVPYRNTSTWSLAKKDNAPRGVRQLPDGTWAVRYACGLKSLSGLRHLHQERVGHVKRDAIRVYHARRARALAEPGWCPTIERREERERMRAAEARRVTFRQYAAQHQAWRKVNRPRSCAKDPGRFAEAIRHFGDHYLDQIAPLDIERFRDSLIARGSPRPPRTGDGRSSVAYSSGPCAMVS
jgi:hypothetical protein